MSSQTVKIIIAGDGNVGKTSLIRLYTEQKFSTSRVATIGVDFYVHNVQLPEGTVKLSIWDMAGQERYRFFRSDFYRGSQAAALVYDVTQPESFKNLESWRNEILAIVPRQKFLIIGNKIDLPRVQDVDEVNQYAENLGCTYLETSCLSGEGVPFMFLSLARLAIEQDT